MWVREQTKFNSGMFFITKTPRILAICCNLAEVRGGFRGRSHPLSFLQHLTLSLRNHAYSNILKMFPPKNENFQIKILIFLLFLLIS